MQNSKISHFHRVTMNHRGAVVAQWIRPWTLNHCLVPRIGLQAVGPLVACFLSGQVK